MAHNIEHINKVRLNFAIDPALKARLDNIPWGTRSLLLSKLTSWLCDMHEQHGSMAIGLILSGRFQLSRDERELEHSDGTVG